MAGTRVQSFTEAKRVLRNHPDWTDEQVAERIGISRMEIPDILPVARREVEADRPEVNRRTSVGDRPYPHTDAQDAEAERTQGQ